MAAFIGTINLFIIDQQAVKVSEPSPNLCHDKMKNVARTWKEVLQKGFL